MDHDSTDFDMEGVGTVLREAKFLHYFVAKTRETSLWLRWIRMSTFWHKHRLTKQHVKRPTFGRTAKLTAEASDSAARHANASSRRPSQVRASHWRKDVFGGRSAGSLQRQVSCILQVLAGRCFASADRSRPLPKYLMTARPLVVGSLLVKGPSSGK